MLSTRAALARPGEFPTRLGTHFRQRLRGLRNPLLSRLRTRGYRKLRKVIFGCNQGYWRSDLVRANGFNEEIEGWGSEDRELAVRLMNAGLTCLRLQHMATAWHLFHKRGDRSRRHRNRTFVDRARDLGLKTCEHGLLRHMAPEAAAAE